MSDPAAADESQGETYGVVTATHRSMQRAIAEMLSREGLTHPQFLALRAVAKRGAIGMRKISDDLLVTPANVTGIVGRLQEKGLITRATRKGDRRASVIELTEEGKATHQAAALKYGKLMQTAVETFTSEEREVLRRLLQKLQRGMARSSLRP